MLAIGPLADKFSSSCWGKRLRQVKGLALKAILCSFQFHCSFQFQVCFSSAFRCESTQHNLAFHHAACTLKKILRNPQKVLLKWELSCGCSSVCQRIGSPSLSVYLGRLVVIDTERRQGLKHLESESAYPSWTL